MVTRRNIGRLGAVALEGGFVRPVVAWLVFALAAVIVGVGVNGSAVAATRTTPVVIAPVKVVDYGLFRPGGRTTAAVPVPADATSATFEVWAKYAWRSTRVSVCAGAEASTSCLKHPALVSPVQRAGIAQVTVDLSALGDEKVVTVVNSTASARITVTLLGYSVPSEVSPTASSGTAPTAAATSSGPEPKPPTTSAPSRSDGVSATSPSPTAGPTEPTAEPSTTAAPETTPPPATSAAPTTPAAPPPPKAPAAPAQAPPPAAPPAPPAPPPVSTPTVPPAGGATDKAHWQAPMVTGLDPAWPGPSNTGVPAGTALTVWDGDMTITTPGAHIDGMEIRGFVTVRAADVLITNSRIIGPASVPGGDKALLMVGADGASVTVQDSELYAQVPNYHVRAVIGKNFTLVRVNSHHVVDHMVITGDNVTVQDSWLHDNAYFLEDPNYGNKPTHDDNVQVSIGQNIRFLHNTMQGTHNAAIMVTQDRGPVTGFTVQGNFIDNGACSINIAEKSYGPVQGMTIQDNVFGGNTWVKKCAILAPATTASKLALANNRWLADGSPVAVSKG